MAIPIQPKIDRATTTNILYLVAGLVALVIVVVLFWKFRNKIASRLEANQTSGRILEENKKDEVIAEQSNVPVENISRARSIARNVAKAMGTHKDMPWWKTGTEDETLIINLMNQLGSEHEAILCAEFYQKDYTDSHMLRADIDSYLTNNQKVQIEYLNELI